MSSKEARSIRLFVLRVPSGSQSLREQEPAQTRPRAPAAAALSPAAALAAMVQQDYLKRLPPGAHAHRAAAEGGAAEPKGPPSPLGRAPKAAAKASPPSASAAEPVANQAAPGPAFPEELIPQAAPGPAFPEELPPQAAPGKSRSSGVGGGGSCWRLELTSERGAAADGIEAPCKVLFEPGPEQKRARVDAPPRRGDRA